MHISDTRYARSGELSIAYRVAGSGALDIVFIPGFVSHVELILEPGPMLPIIEGLARFGRVVIFDKRGTGLSDRLLGAGTLEERMDDVRAVMDAEGLASAVIFGVSEGGPMSVLFAATYPERVRSLVLMASYARPVQGDGYPHGPSPSDVDGFLQWLESRWGTGKVLAANTADAPPGDEPLRLAARFERNASTPGVASAIMRANSEIDVRDVLPAIRVPTLVLHATGDPFVDVAHGRHLAAHIAGAELVELDGDFHVSWDAERYGPALEATERFLTGTAHAAEPDRVLKTVLFTDIVDSTRTAVRVGDARWHELLDAHDRLVRSELVRYRGEEIATTGDGFLAAFDGPARGIRCARTIVERSAAAGLPVRAGLHTGECERRGSDLAGLAVHIGARVAARAEGGEVLVSSTVRELVAGSGLDFVARGEHELKGVPGTWRLFAVAPDPSPSGSH